MTRVDVADALVMVGVLLCVGFFYLLWPPAILGFLGVTAIVVGFAKAARGNSK